MDKHPVAILIGAGCPQAIRITKGSGGTAPLIPDVAGLTRAIGDKLATNAVYAAINGHFSEDGRHSYTIEDILSHVRLLARVAGNGNARGIKRSELIELEDLMCSHIAAEVGQELPCKSTPYHQVARWISGVRRKTPVSLFTTNYDLLMEQAFEDERVPYFDGFVGSRNPFFDTSAIDGDSIPLRWSLLWKLHGSINWRKSGNDDGAVIRTSHFSDSKGVLIHPSEMKYDQSRKMPYLAMIDKLKDFLRKPSALVTIGYSYSDEHINDVLIQGARNNPSAVVFGLLFKRLSDEPGVSKISTSIPNNILILANDKAIIRGKEDLWPRETRDGKEIDGCFPLGDFSAFGSFLGSISHIAKAKSDA